MADRVAEDAKFLTATLTKKREKRDDPKDEVKLLDEESKGAMRVRERPTAPVDAADDTSAENPVAWMEVGDRHTLVRPHALEAPEIVALSAVLQDWINVALADRRIIVRSIVDDLFDGQVLSELLDELAGVKIENQPHVGLSTQMQRLKLKAVLAEVARILRVGNPKWTVTSIHNKDPIAIYHLLIALARHFHCPIPLPHHVKLRVIEVRKEKAGKIVHRDFLEELTAEEVIPDEDGEWPSTEPDVFDTLFEAAPEKLRVVQTSLKNFCNRHLDHFGLKVDDLAEDFHDGVSLILIVSVLGGFFVPLCEYSLAPVNYEAKLSNVKLGFRLMREEGVPKTKARSDQVVNKDLKATLRVLYSLFQKYKTL